MVYKTRSNAPATPAAASPAPDNGNLQCILEAVAGIIELCARQQAEIDGLRDKVDVYTKLPGDQARSTRDLVESRREVRAALADVRSVLERVQSIPLDLPALPRRDFN